jgi:excisionase family DNA binding protein
MRCEPPIASIAHMESQVQPLAYSVVEGARLLGISYAKTKQEVALGRLRSVKAGRRRLIPAAALREWIADREGEAAN